MSTIYSMTHYDIIMCNAIARSIHCDVTMSNDIGICTYDDITMHNNIAMSLFYICIIMSKYDFTVSPVNSLKLFIKH